MPSELFPDPHLIARNIQGFPPGVALNVLAPIVDHLLRIARASRHPAELEAQVMMMDRELNGLVNYTETRQWHERQRERLQRSNEFYDLAKTISEAPPPPPPSPRPPSLPTMSADDYLSGAPALKGPK